MSKQNKLTNKTIAKLAASLYDTGADKETIGFVGQRYNIGANRLYVRVQRLKWKRYDRNDERPAMGIKYEPRQ